MNVVTFKSLVLILRVAVNSSILLHEILFIHHLMLLLWRQKCKPFHHILPSKSWILSCIKKMRMCILGHPPSRLLLLLHLMLLLNLLLLVLNQHHLLMLLMFMHQLHVVKFLLTKLLLLLILLIGRLLSEVFRLHSGRKPWIPLTNTTLGIQRFIRVLLLLTLFIVWHKLLRIDIEGEILTATAFSAQRW